MAQTEFTIAVATAAKLETELLALPFDQTGLSVYDNGTGGARIIYARTLNNDESQEVEQALSLHTADSPLVNYIELVGATEGNYPEVVSNTTGIYISTQGGGGIRAYTNVNLSNYEFRGLLNGTVGFLIELALAQTQYLKYTQTTSGPLLLTAIGSAADIGLNLIPKGTGRVQENGVNVVRVSDTLAVLAATTSAQLAGVISDETGTGLLVFATNPVLTTPNIGTPSAGVLTNCTGLPAAGLAAMTSAELAGIISNETGSGLLVFATSPTLTTPVLGVATATSINKVAITAPATSATLTLIDGTTLTGPAASGTAMTLGNTETITGVKTLSTNTPLRFRDTGSEIQSPSVNTLALYATTGIKHYSNAHSFLDEATTSLILYLSATPNAVNYLEITNSTAADPTLDVTAAGNNANININFYPKGTGKLQSNDTDVLLSGGAMGTPASGTLTNCTGLPVAGGGTGAATFTDGGVLVGNTTGAIQATAVGTAGHVLTSNGAGSDPTFQALGTGSIANLSVFAAGTAYALTNSAALLNFGTTDPVLVINSAGTYLITARAHTKYTAATFASPRVVTLKLRRTNNTAADLTNGTIVLYTRASVAVTTETMADSTWSVLYTTANSDDSIEIYGSMDTVPGAGTLDATEASIIAIKLS